MSYKPTPINVDNLVAVYRGNKREALNGLALALAARDAEIAALKAIAERLAGAIKRMKAARDDCVALRNWAVGFEDWSDVEEVLAANTDGDAALSEFHAKVKP
jgi:hypothetical protein